MSQPKSSRKGIPKRDKRRSLEPKWLELTKNIDALTERDAKVARGPVSRRDLHRAVAEAVRDAPPNIDVNPLGIEHLSPRHHAFIHMVTSGVDVATAAARAAGKDPLVDRVYWYSVAAELLGNRTVDQLIKNKLAKIQDVVIHDSNKLRLFVMSGLATIAASESSTPAVRVRAYELLGKTEKAALFQDRREVTINDTRKSVEIRAELLDRLKSLFGAEAEKIIESSQRLSIDGEVIVNNPPGLDDT